MKLNFEFIKESLSNSQLSLRLEKENDYSCTLWNGYVNIEIGSERREKGLFVSINDPNSDRYYRIPTILKELGISTAREVLTPKEQKEYDSLPFNETIIFVLFPLIERCFPEILEGDFSNLGEGFPNFKTGEY